MSRFVRLAVTSLATLEDTAPPFNLRHPDPQDTLELGLRMLEAAGQGGANLACLPEGFMAAGLPAHTIPKFAEAIDGPSLRAVADSARRHRMYVVAGAYVAEGGHVANRAVVFDRNGDLVGSYSKRHATEGEIDNGVVPGDEAVVVQTDFGRLGLAICFDSNWPALWAELKAKGAELVCWISAYEGGFPLQAYAWTHQFPIVTSVWPFHSRVIERTGRVVAETSRWSRVVFHDLNLDKRLFHTNGHEAKLIDMQIRYGRAIRIEALNDEHVFTLESLTPEVHLDDVAREFGLVEFGAFIDRCSRVQDQSRSTLRQAAE